MTLTDSSTASRTTGSSVNRESVAEVKKLFNLAEQYAKEVEVLSSAVQVPAINELRYAGHHILNAIDEFGNVSDDELGKAKSHCHRAMYEAVEAGIMFCLDEIKAFQEDHRGLVVSDVIHDYHERLVRAQQAVKMIVAGRADRESIEQHVEQYRDEFRAVREIVQLFEVSRDDLSAKKAQQVEARQEAEQRRRRDYLRIAVTALMAALGIMATVFFS